MSLKESEALAIYRKHFPDLVEGKTKTLDLLEASEGVASLVDTLGRVFSPLSYDILGNIEKLRKSYEKDAEKFSYIEDMILWEKSDGQGVSIDALLWLKRALHFVVVFFGLIVEDKEKSEFLAEHMTKAYSQTLEAHHGWITRKLFTVFRRMVPSRNTLYTAISGDTAQSDDVTTQSLRDYIATLDVTIKHFDEFYQQNGLESTAKAP